MKRSGTSLDLIFLLLSVSVALPQKSKLSSTFWVLPGAQACSICAEVLDAIPLNLRASVVRWPQSI